jgi:hypothetical protein
MKATRKRLLFTVLLTTLIAIGFGLWARPVSLINGYSYMRLWLSVVRSRSVAVDPVRVHYDVSGRPMVLSSYWSTAYQGAPRIGRIYPLTS